jgi:U4/U6.U5 tri-snRNP-associated protein 2
VGTHYDLLANISHEGKAEAGKGTYKVHVRHRGTEQWYQIQDLIVEEIMPQMIFMSESYIQVSYMEKKKNCNIMVLNGFYYLFRFGKESTLI